MPYRKRPQPISAPRRRKSCGGCESCRGERAGYASPARSVNVFDALLSGRLSKPGRGVVWVAALGVSATLLLQSVNGPADDPATRSTSDELADTVGTSAGGGGDPHASPAHRLAEPVAAPEVPESRQVGGAGGTVGGVPETVLRAYRAAAGERRREDGPCRLSVPLLAAIGQVESGHARGGDVRADGSTRNPIIGPPLNGGPGVAAIEDTDGGRYDGNPVWDHAVGPMQFIPSTWATWRADGNGDGAADPHNVFDAALAAGRYLCAAGGDLSTGAGLRRAVLAYNPSQAYLSSVLAWLRVYASGATPVPDVPAGSVSTYRQASTSPEQDDSAGRRRPSDRHEPAEGERPLERAAPAPAPSQEPPPEAQPGERDRLPAAPGLPEPFAEPEPDPETAVSSMT